MQKLIFGILISLILSAGCVSSEKVFTNIQGADSKKKLEFFTGQYNNEPSEIKDEFEVRPLYEMLFKPFYSFEWKEPRDFSGVIELEVISKRKIKAKYFSGGVLLKSKILKGIFKDGVFSVRKKVKVRGIPIIYFFYDEVKIIFGSSKNGDLIVSYGSSSFGNVLIASGGGETFYRERYERVE